MKQTIRKLLTLLVVVAMSSGVWAETKTITYLNYVGGTAAFAEASDWAEKITSESDNLSGWYYVEGTVTINRTLNLSDHTTIILCDGAELKIVSTFNNGIFGWPYNLTIYAQSSGPRAGKLTIKSPQHTIFGVQDLTINGGIISATSDYGYGIDCYSPIINGGNVEVTCSASDNEGIIVHSLFTINGGKLTVTGSDTGIICVSSIKILGGQVTANGGTNYGISTYGNINLGWTNATDFIKASSYKGNVKTADSNPFNIEGGGSLDGNHTLSDTEKGNIAGKKLTPNTTDPIYTISRATGISSDNIEFDKHIAFAGERVAITVTPPTGKILSSLTYSDGTNTYGIGTGTNDIKRQANDYVITMPAANITVTATFAAAAARIGTTNYLTLQEALDAATDHDVIDILTDITEPATAKTYTGSPSLTLNLNGNDVEIDDIQGLANMDINGPGSLTLDVLGNANVGNENTLTVNGATIVCKEIQWYADHIVIKGGSDVTVNSIVNLGGGDGEFTFTIEDDASIVRLVNCSISGYDPARTISQLRQWVRPADLSYFDTQTGNNDPVKLNLRKDWGLMLTHAFGTKAEVTFWDGGTTEPVASSFNLSAYTDANKITNIDNSTADHYLIAHVVPADGYWTDPQLLMGMEAAGSLARGRAPGLDLPRSVTLLKRDTYSDTSSDPAVTRDRQDGAGWYYYKLSKEHNTAAGYTASVIDGEVVRKFDFSYGNSGNVTQNGTLITINNGEGWTAELTLDDISFPFTGKDIGPEFTNATVKNGTKTIFTLAEADIANQLRTPYKISVISSDLQVRTNAKSEYTWFTKYSGDDAYVANGSESSSTYAITVPFTVANETAPKGTDTNPWLIRTAEELNLLSKCVNMGQYTFDGEFLQQTADIDMSEINDAYGKNDFLPIGNDNIPFSGTFDGNSNTISNLTLNPAAGDLAEDGSGFSIGLFGTVFPMTYPTPNIPTITNMTLSNCTFTSTITDDQVSIGCIVGYLNFGNITNCSVNECTVSASVGDYYVAIGGIAGFSDSGATISGCTATSCTISGTGEKDAVGGIVGRLEEVAMPVVSARGVSVKAPAEVPIKGNRVKSTADKKTAITGSHAGAIIGVISVNTPSTEGNFISDNLYDYNVEVTQGTTTNKSYTKRGINIIGGTADSPTYTLTDIETNSGAMMEIYPVTLSVTSITGYSPTLQIDADPTTTAVDALAVGTTCYKFDDSDVPYLAAGDVKTLVIAPTITRTDDGRTFYADLNTLTLNSNDLTIPTSGNTTTFTMPSATATIAATYSEADWFTIDTNQKQWMTFYHEWTTSADPTASPVAANYAVTDLAGTKSVSALTITDINVKTGDITTDDLSRVSFNGMPTLFYCKNGLPEKLKFTPDANASTNVVPSSYFHGTTTDKDMSEFTNVYVLNPIGDFFYVDITSTDKTLAAHRCYVALGNTAVVAPARLHIVDGGDADGIETLSPALSEDEGAWFSLDGRKLNGKPTKKGLYINKGIKVVIK